MLLFLCILNSRDVQSFPLPFCGTLLDLFRIFMRFLDMKYGFWRDPSFRSKSSTVKRGNVTCVNLSFSCVCITSEVQNLLTEAEKECVHTHVVHTEESVSYEVASNHNSLYSTDWQNKDISDVMVWRVNEREKKMSLTIIGIQ